MSARNNCNDNEDNNNNKGNKSCKTYIYIYIYSIINILPQRAFFLTAGSFFYVYMLCAAAASMSVDTQVPRGDPRLSLLVLHQHCHCVPCELLLCWPVHQSTRLDVVIDLLCCLALGSVGWSVPVLGVPRQRGLSSLVHNCSASLSLFTMSQSLLASQHQSTTIRSDLFSATPCSLSLSLSLSSNKQRNIIMASSTTVRPTLPGTYHS